MLDHNIRNAATDIFSGAIKKAGQALMAAARAYGFLDSKPSGRTHEECNDDNLTNTFLVLEYKEDYLHAWFMSLEFLVRWACTVEKIVIVRAFDRSTHARAFLIPTTVLGIRSTIIPNTCEVFPIALCPRSTDKDGMQRILRKSQQFIR